MSESLITASMGMVKLGKQHYLQIITAEEYKFYYTPVNSVLAKIIMQRENLSCQKVDDLPDKCMLITEI